MMKLVIFVTLCLLDLVLGQGCPERYGVQTYPHDQYCDRFYLCVNGTLTEEVCANGLLFDGHGHIHNHCNYNWAVDCGDRKYDDTPISSPGCLYQYGIYPVGKGCQTTFFKCAEGVAYETACPKGQVYSNEEHLCNHADSVYECQGQSENVVGFKCPSDDELPPNAIARRFLPFPRFPLPGDKSAYIVCVNYQPRVQNCGDYSEFDENTLSCIYNEHLAPHEPAYPAPAPHAPAPYAPAPYAPAPHTPAYPSPAPAYGGYPAPQAYPQNPYRG